MAQRRMFSPAIVSSDAFLDMPASSQALYFQLGMRADDDGFVNPRGAMRLVNASEDDLKILIAKRFVLPFENGVIVIKHWKVNNLIKNDRYKPTIYEELKSTLYEKSNGAYTEKFQNGSTKEPQVRLGKVNTAAAPHKSMKKNRMGSYREDSASDSHEESIDLETGETSKPKEKAGVLPAYKELVEWAEKRRGFKFVSVVKQYKAFKEAKTFGLNPPDLKKRWLDLEADKFYADKGFDWTTVVYSFNRKGK